MHLRPTCVPLMAMVLFFTLVNAVAPAVEVSYSKYRGKDLGNGVTHWLGMRYAAPPLGDLRFMPPRDPVRSRQTKNANKFRLKCVSQSAKVRFIGKSQSEDCLFLNVFAPSNASRNAKLPVLVYIQGGGFNDNSRSKINGADLIRASDMKMVVVTLNYRVSVLRFLSYGDKVQPNNGLLDQRKALQWVQKYISRFGGNPRHVVLGGSSSGGASVAFHLTAYGDSGTSVVSSRKLIENVGCSSEDAIACMRTKTIAEIIAANIKVPYPGGTRLPIGMWVPVVDGDFVQDALWSSFDQGKFVKVPSIIGATTNEGRAFAPAASSKTEVEDFFKAEFPLLESAHMTQITALYPGLADTCSKAGCLKRPLSDAYGDMRFQCSGISFSESISRWMPKKTWNYWYNVEDPGFMAQGRGVAHCDEAHAIWGPGNGGSGAPRSYFPGGINANTVNVVQG
ncbi:cholinesterase precursor, partial [Fusarium denticulatum]